MSVLVFAETSEGKFKKSNFEATSYGKKVAEQLGTNIVVLTINSSEPTQLYKYGAEKVLNVSNDNLKTFNAKVYADVIKQAAEKESAQVIIIDTSANGLYLAPIIAVDLNAGYASNVVAPPSSVSPFTIKRKTFSNKAFNNTQITTEIKVIGLAKNSYGLHENEVSGTVEEFSPSLIESTLVSQSIEQTTGKLSLIHI